MIDHYEILQIEDLIEREILLREYYNNRLKIPSSNTGRKSIITDEEYKDYVNIFVEYDLKWKRFPANHSKFPNYPMARTIRDYFNYEAKVNGFDTYTEFVEWRYSDGDMKPSGQLLYLDVKYNDEKN